MAWATGPGSGRGHSVGAGSPFDDYTAAVVMYVILSFVLVITLLFGAFLLLNLGLLSKRPEDKIGTRTPGEPGFLKNTIWPAVPYEVAQLPAEEEEDEILIEEERKRKKAS